MDETRRIAISDDERRRLAEGIRAGFSIPLIDDVEDYVFEVILCHMKALPLIDPIEEGRKKLLFDVTAADGRGWSAKTLMVARTVLAPGKKFEFVIQRSNIFKKAEELGFAGGLTRNSPVEDLGRALVEHWNKKFREDSKIQGVTDPRIAVLLKDSHRRKFAYIEMPYHELDADDFEWRWSRNGGAGLKAFDANGTERFKWYFGQTQFFEVLTVPNDALIFELDWRRHSLEELMRRTLSIDLAALDGAMDALSEIAKTSTDVKSRELAQKALASLVIEALED